jgi:phosphate-selective porin OprO/OprP
MDTHAVGALALAGLGSGGETPAFEEPGSGLLTVKLADDVTMKFFGRLFVDWGWFTGDEPTYNTDTSGTTPELEDGTEFRTARLGVEGLLYDKTGYKAEFDFAPGTVAAKDVYFTLKDVLGSSLGGEFRVGHFKEPFGLEQLTSSRFISFMERSLAAAFSPDRNSGFQVGDYNDAKTMTWAAGMFRTTNDQAKAVGDGEYSYTARVTGTPWYTEEGAKMLHLGGAVSYRLDDTVQFRSRPEANMVNRPADTGAIAADDTLLVGLETAVITGPFSAQAEYQMASVSASGAGQDGDFAGYYLYLSWFLTGEHRNYKTSAGAFDRIRPNENFNAGPGAIEFLARYSAIDLDDGMAFTDEMRDTTVGVNWYLNGASRVMLNWVHSNFEDSTVDDSMDALMLRFQMDW